MHFIDSHAHLTDQNVYENLPEVILRAKKANVSKIINICTDKDSLDKGLDLSEKYDFIYLSAASTPHDVEKNGEEFFKLVEKAIINKKLVAIGETGLDYHYELSKKQIQKKYLIEYLLLSKKYNLPIIFHVREAFSDLFSITDEFYKNQKALLHCFTGTLQESKQVLDRGWYLSFSGIVTFKKNDDLRNVLKTIPLDRILIETDSPLLAPQSKRGKKNEPANVVEIAECIAKVKNLSLEKIAEITYENTIKFFCLSLDEVD
jgi:TatD DNase family protein